MIDTIPERTIIAEAYPAFKEMLSLPLCGETRTIFCYVKAHQREKFFHYVQEKFSAFCEIYPSEQLVKD
ncbi:MAG: hypothetical protein LBP53_03370 [Candidatus Peribacteria bacterium]|jgi:hypothetical protein|nr:hypothetical protein [Candidatus Peribacteria bacterium]